MQYTVYVLQSREGFTYVGYTNNLRRRLREHNAGQSKATRKGTNWRVVYSECCSTRPEARQREKYLKSHAGKEWLIRHGYL